MSDVEISQLNTGIVKADIEFPATDPLDTTEAASGTTNKYFMSDMLNYNLASQGIHAYQSCAVATTANLNAIYNNGIAGVGATLTNAGGQAALQIDGVTLSLDDRVLVKNQAAALQNGIYTVLDAGSATTNWILQRATDFDATAEIVQYGAVLIAQGVANNGTYFQETAASPIVVGVDAITFAEFFNPCAYLNGVTGTGEFVGSIGATLVAPNLGTPASGDLSNCTGVNVDNPSGVLPVLHGGTGVTTSTGTTNVVLSDNPTLVSPIINQINDANGNTSLGLTATAGAENYINIANNSAGQPPYIQVLGNSTDIPLVFYTKNNASFLFVSAETNQPVTFYNGTNSQHSTTFSFSNTAASRTVTFQDADGTVAYLSDIAGSNDLKAWVNFDGTTSPGTIRASLNVSSVTVPGTGQYTINFITPLANTNFASVCGYNTSANGSYAVAPTVHISNKNVNYVSIYCAAGNNSIYSFTVVNHSDLSVAIFNS